MLDAQMFRQPDLIPHAACLNEKSLPSDPTLFHRDFFFSVMKINHFVGSETTKVNHIEISEKT